METRAGACIVLLRCPCGTGERGRSLQGCAAWRWCVLWLSGELWKMLQLPMHRVISKAGGIAVLLAGKVIPAGLGAVGVRNALHLPLLSCRAWGGGSCSFWPWSIPVPLWLCTLPSLPSTSCFILLCLSACAESHS